MKMSTSAVNTSSPGQVGRRTGGQQDRAPTDAANMASDPARAQGQEPQIPPKRKSTTSSAVKRRFDAKTYDRLSVNVYAGDRERLKQAAAARRTTVNALIIAAVNAYLGDDVLTPMTINPYLNK